MLIAPMVLAPHGGGGRANCARSGATRSWRSRWPCPKPCTTLLFEVHGTCRTQPYGDRSRTGQEVDELLAAGVRPPSLGEPPGPAVKVGRVQQPGAFEPLDVPVLQMEDQLVEVPTTPGYAFAVVAVQTLGGRQLGLCLSRSPPAQGGIQILGRAEARLGSGFGVPVIMQLKFQQSFVVSVDVPQVPFIDGVVDISVASQRQGSTVQTVQKTGDSPGAVL